MSEGTPAAVSNGNSKGLVVGVLGIVAALGAFIFAFVSTNGLKEELRKDREAHAAALKSATEKSEGELKGVAEKTLERFDQLEKSVASADKSLGDRAFTVETRVEALEKPGRTRKDVEEHPEKYLSVKNVGIFNPGLINDYAALSLLELENKSAADIIWIELKVTYFKGDREVGSKTFTLGDAGIRNPEKAVLPKNSTVTGKRNTGTYGEKADLFLNQNDSQISGKADRATVQILRVKSLE